MHVISGRFKGLALGSARSETRPTTDRTKEAIFSRLDATGVLDDACVLDLFGGTGALGIEALSRGARALTVVEASAQAAQLIARTLTALQHHANWQRDMSVRVVRAKVERFVAKAHVEESFDVVFMDPPYALSTAVCEEILATVVKRELIDEFGVMIVERSTRSEELQAPEGWDIQRRDDYGETAVYTLRSIKYLEQ